jgi:hypothetical protein
MGMAKSEGNRREHRAFCSTLLKVIFYRKKFGELYWENPKIEKPLIV